ncbi:chemotaxis protein [Mangrovicoccus algicola]|uniref:Chemotaxis protein n=1 Tax=Mangrovicoccus algicola TaxID=2771008 RepID=A0A8J7D0M5_9RHOB|nr:chemotaxis protein [Mangrovicoccus algicola]MBE3639658.1 chemotaxis protein [Mangrovicoccus algicola]
MTGPHSSPHRPSQGEAPFAAEELFFSRTDPRGVIQAGNTVFQRVSDHPWNKLLGAPHKIIRHKDMPRGAFHLMWAAIKGGDPVGVYVKNHARDGLHYWVFAIVVPLKDGFLSVRLKPLSPLLQEVEADYAALAARERANDLAPEAAEALLLERLAEHGHRGYRTFMTHALAAEMEARDARLGRHSPPWLGPFRTMLEAVSDVSEQTRELSAVFESIRGIPYNMRILASRLEAAGGPISVISANYGILSEEISGWMRSFAGGDGGAFSDIRDAVERALFVQCAACLLEEMGERFAAEEGLQGHVDVAAETRMLADQGRAFAAAAEDGVAQVARKAEKFSQAVRDMKRLITGLGATRMMCKIEGARLRNSGDNLVSVIRQLDQFQENIEERLQRINERNRMVQRMAETLTGGPAETGPAERAARLAAE